MVTFHKASRWEAFVDRSHFFPSVFVHVLAQWNLGLFCGCKVLLRCICDSLITKSTAEADCINGMNARRWQHISWLYHSFLSVLTWLLIYNFQCFCSSSGVTMWWEQQGPSYHQSVWYHRGVSCLRDWQAAVVLAIPRWMGSQQMSQRSEMHKYWAVCSTQLESSTVIAVPSSSDRRENALCLGK